MAALRQQLEGATGKLQFDLESVPSKPSFKETPADSTVAGCSFAFGVDQADHPQERTTIQAVERKFRELPQADTVVESFKGQLAVGTKAAGRIITSQVTELVVLKVAVNMCSDTAAEQASPTVDLAAVVRKFVTVAQSIGSAEDTNSKAVASQQSEQVGTAAKAKTIGDSTTFIIIFIRISY